MTARKWQALEVGGLLAAFVGVPLLINGLAARGPHAEGLARYDAIAIGMTRDEVRRVVLGSGPVLVSEFPDTEIMHLDGRSMIAVVYEPASGDRVVREKRFVELGRGGPVDDALVGLGLRPRRVVRRDAPPR